jgi:uncharacterized protein (DUF1810 family)
MTNPFNLERFVTATGAGLRYRAKRAAGRPEAKPLDVVRLSSVARPRPFRNGRILRISSLAEARTYLAHPVLGPRLDLCTRTVLEIEAPSLNAIFGSPDDMKFRSCATLFALASGEQDNPFQRALDRWCNGRPDDRTLALTRHEN